MAERRALRLCGLFGAAVLASVALAQEDAFGFMPPGGRSVFATLVAGDPARLGAVAARSDDRAGWADWARAEAPDMAEVRIATFAAYAAFNLPVAEDRRARIAESGDAALLPPDGKALAIQQCQFCHSFFTGYLMHDRDEAGWRGIFKAPFHAEIPMTERERDTFASYSALNLPLAIQDVPPELRF